MFIEQGIRPDNQFWKYLVGSVIVIAAAFIGQVPMIIAFFVESMSSGRPFPTDETLVMTFLSPNQTLFWLMLSFAFAMAAVVLVVKYLHRQTMLSVTTARKKVDWRRVFFSFILWSVFSIVSTLVDYYFSPEDYKFNFDPVKFAILCVIAVLLIPIQTSTEEYVFRGYLMQGFGNLAKNRWFPLVMTSVIFGGMHILNPEVGKMGYSVMIYYIGTGFFLGIITLMDDGMELALGFHAANNLTAALLVTSDWSALQTESILKNIAEPTAGLEIMLPVLVIFPLLLLIFSKKYRWTGWEEKLTGNIHEKPDDATNDHHIH